MLPRVLFALFAVTVLAACEPTASGGASPATGASAQGADVTTPPKTRNYRMSGSRAGAR